MNSGDLLGYEPPAIGSSNDPTGPPIAAKPTQYRGITMRSRLEANWAHFLDTCDIRWTYEPRRIVIGDLVYLPDFKLDDLHMWFEAKGRLVDKCIAKPLAVFNRSTGNKFKIAIGDGEGRVIMPFEQGGTLHLSGATIWCSECSGVWFANPYDPDATVCPHCAALDGGSDSVRDALDILGFGGQPGWPGTYDPAEYRSEISDPDPPF